MSARDFTLLTTRHCGRPLETGNLNFNSGAPVSGLLDNDELYRLTADADVWVGAVSGVDVLTSGVAVLLLNDQELWFTTATNQTMLQVLGVAGGGTLNYSRWKL